MKNNESKFIKIDYYNNLYGYYQKLLTEKQQEIFESYYFDDLSLSEIAENYQISRNAVFDTLKKAQNALDNYENILQLAKKDKILNEYLEELKSEVTEKGLRIIETLKEME